MYYSKVVIICWASIYLAGLFAAAMKRRWLGFKYILAGSLIMVAGIGASTVLNNPLGALALSAALLLAAFFTLTGIIKVFGHP